MKFDWFSYGQTHRGPVDVRHTLIKSPNDECAVSLLGTRPVVSVVDVPGPWSSRSRRRRGPTDPSGREDPPTISQKRDLLSISQESGSRRSQGRLNFLTSVRYPSKERTKKRKINIRACSELGKTQSNDKIKTNTNHSVSFVFGKNRR